MASRCSLKGISAMPINFRIFALIPMGLIVESVAQLDDSILVTWGPDADRRAKLLICLAVEGALLDAYSQSGTVLNFHTGSPSLSRKAPTQPLPANSSPAGPTNTRSS